ncbi:ubiquitin carboxyl-terminal hydrolase 31 isoform X2 [Nematostella vectensis]|uniref:ubiquitin carboxyl-terminal hydrolase 31 isoform X2 n=1 Tax=Nematostella vectensis TaxID=45351 RepID=UPI0020779724|nr:ubiquitin carboxyl-terminal hydrolase 31 isoform X2 [Nematostella vectensis]
MSFKSRAASLGELNGGQSERSEETMERCKSSRSLAKKKSFRFGSKNREEGRKLSRKASMKSVSNMIQKIVVKMSSVAVQLPANETSSSNGDLTRVENASYKQRNSDDNLTTNKLDSGYDRTPEVFSLTGLKNHGNTCFINAIIQCLAHTDLLAEYFVMGGYKQDLKLRKGQIKKFGTKGEVTEKLAVLLKSLWYSEYSGEVSSEFKSVVGKHGAQYRGYSQHDAQEFLLWLLDIVHEDLNRATKRKYKANKDNLGRSDECIATEALNNHLRCNDSFVLDLFQAQYRSALSCPKCKQKSTTFDPFLCLSLPIPQRSLRPLLVTIVFVGASRAPLRIGVSVPISGSISDLCAAISEMTDIPCSSLIITELSSDGFNRRFYANQPLSIIHDSDAIYGFEAPQRLYPSQQNDGCSVTSPGMPEGPDSIVILLLNSQGQGRQIRRFGQPFVVHVLQELSFSKLQALFLHEMDRMLLDNADFQIKKHRQLFRLRVMNGLAGRSYLSSELDHPLYTATVESALTYNKGSTGPAHIRMVLEWESELRNSCIKPDVQDSPEEHTSVQNVQNLFSNTHAVNLDNCFELYTKDETLGLDDAWLCPRCKKLQQGTVKKLSLWSLPEVLIIHLKRFRQCPSGRTKLHTLVEFPVNDLDMSPHLEPRHKIIPDTHSVLTNWPHWRRTRRSSGVAGEDNLYDLYAVCNHLGNMSGGHYTAHCRNPTDGQWYLYDDTRVEQVPVNQVTTQAAYLLFYARRNLGCSSASESSGSLDHWTRRIPPRVSRESLVTSSREELNDDSNKPQQAEAIDAPKEPSMGPEGTVVAESCV